MEEIIKQLQEIARIADRTTDAGQAERAIRQARTAIQKAGDNPLLQNLSMELLTWESKLSVIFREPAGRQGMSKHCRHWLEKLKP